jgi:hypothetical protein
METKVATVTFQEFIDALEDADVVSVNGTASTFYVDEHYTVPESDGSQTCHSIRLDLHEGEELYIDFREEDNHTIPYDFGVYSLQTFYNHDGDIVHESPEVRLFRMMMRSID